MFYNFFLENLNEWLLLCPDTDTTSKLRKSSIFFFSFLEKDFLIVGQELALRLKKSVDLGGVERDEELYGKQQKKTRIQYYTHIFIWYFKKEVAGLLTESDKGREPIFWLIDRGETGAEEELYEKQQKHYIKNINILLLYLL